MAQKSYETNMQKTKTAMPELDPVQRAQTFEEVAQGYTQEDAVAEARRCIQCPKSPCRQGCPVGIDIPRFIELVATENFGAAYALIKEENSLPAICGRVCPQETQCEGVCTRGKNGEPVGIGRLERFVADWSFDHAEEAEAAVAARANERALKECGTSADEASANNVSAGETSSDDASASTTSCFDDVAHLDLSGKKAAMVGSGPASLTCAGELAKLGCQVTVFEALHKVGGVLTYGIPEFRLPKDLVEREVSTLGESGVTFEVNTVIGKLFDVDELMDEQGFDAVFIGSGAGLPTYLNIEGEALNGVMMASELLTRVNLMKAYRFPEYDTPVYAGKHCVVVGGGNVAMDAARTAKRLGADVTIVYRRGREEMPARAEEVHHAEQEGIQFQMLTNPTRVLGNDDGWIEGVECERMELGQPDASGRRRPVPIENSEFVIDADMFVVAVGSRANPLIAQTTPGLEATSRNLIKVDEETCATSKPGVYAGGDITSGSATVILAMGAGKRAAASMAKYLARPSQ